MCFYLNAAFVTNASQGHGGTVVQDEDDHVDTIIVDDELEDRYKSKYRDSKTCWVEDPQFIRRCIKKRQYSHRPPTVQRMGGRQAGKM